MRDESDITREPRSETPENVRVLTLKAINIVIFVGCAVSVLVFDFRTAFTFWLGGCLSVLNLFITDKLVKSFFMSEMRSPAFLAVKFFLRYVLLFGSIFFINAFTSLPVVAAILGLASFGFAAVILAVRSLFFTRNF